MKIQPTCVPCLIKRILFESEQCTNDKKLQGTILKSACQLISQHYSDSICSADLATIVHRKTYGLLQTNDPYATLKKESNAVAHSLIPKVEQIIQNSSDSFHTSILCSIIGNALDFGIEGASKHPTAFLSLFEELYNQGITYDETQKLENILKKSKQILFFTDNCGEILFDKIFLEELKKKYPEIKIKLIVKGEPILSDATPLEATQYGLDTVVDKMETTGGFAVGVNFSLLSNSVKNSLQNTDLIICKGMANYESFSETTFQPIAYLMRTKCQPIADSMGIPVHINAVKVYE